MSVKPLGKILNGAALEAIAHLNACNWPDGKIARYLRCSRRTVLRHRQAMLLGAAEHPSKTHRKGEPRWEKVVSRRGDLSKRRGQPRM